MKKVTIYIKPTCGFCRKALIVLKRYEVNPTIIDVAANPGRHPEMVKRANGRTTVPQIFFGNEHIGGCNELVQIEKRGKLNERLSK